MMQLKTNANNFIYIKQELLQQSKENHDLANIYDSSTMWLAKAVDTDKFSLKYAPRRMQLISLIKTMFAI